MEQQNNLRKDYLSKGYIIIKSIFTKEYISKIRQDMINLSSKDMSKYEILGLLIVSPSQESREQVDPKLNQEASKQQRNDTSGLC